MRFAPRRGRLDGRRAAALGAVVVAAAAAVVLIPTLGGGEECEGGGACASSSKLDTCLNPARVEAVRADPTHAGAVFRACRAAVRADARGAGIPTGDQQLRAVFAAAIANRFAPYGNSVALRLDDLVDEPRLDCDNYVALTYHLYRAAGGTGDVDIVGWDGGPVGNHAELIVDGVLLDPTIGVAAEADLRSLLAGEPVRSRLDLEGERALPEYRRRVLAAMDSGGYGRRDLLYWMDSFHAFATGGALVDPDGELRFDGLPPGIRAVRTSS